MKVVANATFTEQDIRDLLHLATWQLPVVQELPGHKMSIRNLKVGPVTHCFLADEALHKFVGVASVMRDALPFLVPAVKGVRIFQSGLLKEYRGFGFIWRVIDLISRRYRVFAGPSMTISGKAMWMKRIQLDHRHIYLITNPDGIYSEGQTQQDPDKKDVKLMFVPIHAHNMKWREKQAWDGSMKTRLLMVNKEDSLLRRYNVDIKND